MHWQSDGEGRLQEFYCLPWLPQLQSTCRSGKAHGPYLSAPGVDFLQLSLIFSFLLAIALMLGVANTY